MTFFWFLYERVAMWPEIAACCPTGGGAITFSLPWIACDEVLEVVLRAVDFA